MPWNVLEVEIERPIPGCIDANRMQLVKVRNERGRNQLGYTRFGAFLHSDLDREIYDFLRIDIASNEAARFDGENPKMPERLEVRFVIRRYRRKAREESSYHANDRRVRVAQGKAPASEEEQT